jgi:hypothetical protein
MCHFVTADTALSVGICNLLPNTKGVVMKTVNDIAPLLELLKMAAERRPYSETGQVSQDDLFCEDHSLLEMWPEACRRTGVGTREFPPGVIKLWKESLGRSN